MIASRSLAIAWGDTPTFIRMLTGLLKPDTVEGSDVEIPEFNVSYKPQKISPKFQASVRHLLHQKMRHSLHETLIADFGESTIGRVAPVDSGFWWIMLLRAYTKSTGYYSLAEMPECQKGMRLILSLCLSEGFDTFPTLLCTDGCCIIDRRMGDLGSYLQRKKPLSPLKALRFALDISRGMNYLHECKPDPVVHCNLMPKNIFLDIGGRLKIAGFGLRQLSTLSSEKFKSSYF